MKTIEERFWPKVDKNGSVPAHRPDLGACWEWTATCTPSGYGQIGRGKRGEGMAYAHRIAYELSGRMIPSGSEIDHLCSNRSCVNPDHLEAIAHRENVLRGDTFVAWQAQRTHCLRGHAFNAENTRIRSDGSRACRECVRVRRQAVKETT